MIENDVNEKLLYMWLWYVIDNINGDIVMLDWYGGIVVMD